MERKIRYIQEGNTIRKVYDFPERKVDAPRKIREQHRRTYRQAKEAPRMSLKMTLLMAVSVIASVAVCINYLDVQSGISALKTEISSLESTIDTVTARNDSLEYEISSYIDVEYIMRVATEELGMVMVKEEQIKNYESTRSEYMEQYNDVPSNK